MLRKQLRRPYSKLGITLTDFLPLKCHNLERHIAGHCGNRIRASVRYVLLAADNKHYSLLCQLLWTTGLLRLEHQFGSVVLFSCGSAPIPFKQNYPSLVYGDIMWCRLQFALFRAANLGAGSASVHFVHTADLSDKLSEHNDRETQ